MDPNIINGINEAYASIQEVYTVQGNARIGSTAAKATDASVSSAVDKALANKGTAVSASSEKGKTGVTGGGSFRMGGSTGGGKSKPKPAPTGGSRPKPTSGPRVQNPAASPAPRVQNPAASAPIARGGGGGMMRMDTMSDVDTYNLVLEYLLDEGFVSTEQSADKIILNMSETWFEDIVEEKKELSREKRNKMFRRAGNLSREALQGGDKGSEAHKKSGKIIKVLNRDAEENDRNDVKEENIEENRRAARSAGGYKDDSKKQPDPSKDGFTGVGNMSIKDIMALNKKIEARKAKKEEIEMEGELVDEGREEDAKKSLDAVKKRQGVLDDHEKKTGKKLDITKTPEYKSHKQNFPGAKRTGKKERGAKETESEKHNRMVNTYIDRLKKHGKTKKQKRDDEAMAKHTSRYD